LLAEDNDTSALLVTEYLTSHGFDMVRVHDGHEIVAVVEKHKPDVVPMDTQMPGISGLDAIHELREYDDATDLPVIAVTALAMPRDRSKCIEAGANEYLSKPVRLSELHELLVGLLA
jgi:CheY-like chemotaxis protein